jgi:poly(3-hydroxybutyrate) depolymerase
LSQGPFHLDTYIEYVMDFIRIVGPEVHVAAVCQPTVPSLAAVSLMAANGETVQARSLILFGGPIDTRRSPTAPNLYAKSHSLRWFESNVIDRVPLRYPGYLRRVYPGFLQHSGFVAMNPDRHLQAHLDFYQHLLRGDGESAEAHRRFYDEYNAVMDMPAEYYLETIERVFQKHELPLGVMKYRGQVVEPAAIRETALLTIEGELDDISGPGQTQAAHDLCAGIPIDKKQDFVVPGVGHYGIFSGRHWREQIYPCVRDFIRANT